MTVRDASAQVVPGGSLRADRRRAIANRTVTRLMLAALLGILVLSAVRSISGAQNLTSAGILGGAINAAMPIMLAGLGGLWSERSGVVNIGLEGMMILGTWFAADFAYLSHSAWMLLVGGLFGGLIGGILHAITTVGFGVDQIISGVAINILAPGIAKYLSGIFFANVPGGGPTQSPKVAQFNALDWHAADDALSKVQGHHWFLISDIAGLLDGIVSSLTVFTIIALLLIPLTWFVLWRTSFGLRLRSCGENPAAAETLGVRVYLMKTVAVLVSGMLAGLAGGFLVQYGGYYHDGQTAGRGFIGLAAMIFGNWRPAGLAAGSGLFGYTDTLQAQSEAPSVHALLLLVAIILALVGAYLLVRRRIAGALVAIVVAALVFLWYATTDSIPSELATYTPQIITLVVLALASQRLRMPAADGLPWRRGQGG